MKHLLNNISEEEKNSIREQHEGGMNVAIENFKSLVETKLGDAKPYLNEMKEEEVMEQDNKVVTISPDQMKMLHDKGECKCGDVTLKFPSYNK